MRTKLTYVFTLIGWLVLAQQTDFIDFKRAQVDISIDPERGEVIGSVAYDFEVIQSVDSVFIDARNMQIEGVRLNGINTDFLYKDDKIIIKQPYSVSTENRVEVQYRAHPKKAMYFITRHHEGLKEVWTQGQGKYTSHWMPSLDDMNEKIEFDLTITAPLDYEVIANGKLMDTSSTSAENLTWSYNMDLPMSSYLVALALGEFDKKLDYSRSGIPMELYYHPDDSARYEPTYRYSKEIFDFLEYEIGVAYPWQNYKQVPLHDFLYAGMENTGATFFSNEYVVDSIGFNDRNYVNVNAHELAHQWFGNMVTETSGVHHWLHEGFATYYALLSERFLFGDDHFYWKLYESALSLEQQDLGGNNTALLNPESTSLTFYEKGAWTLFMLKELVGEQLFKTAVKAYLVENRFKNVSTTDFLGQIEKSGEFDLDAFADVWLRSDDFPIDRALDVLTQKSVFINEYLMIDCDPINSKCAEQLRFPISDQAKIKIISQVPDLIEEVDFNNNWKVRQAIALNLNKISPELKPYYESLLDDPSYITKEAALYNLWINFPDDRPHYLNKMSNVFGLNDLNVRMLWLVLHLNTVDYQVDKKEEVFNELIDYTSVASNVSVRIRAFSYLIMLNACDEQCMSNLNQAKDHHNWQLVKFAKDELAKLEKE
ncbi:MAG: M1 family metallopeptidase [Flavobacteriaceae bacterium]|nr:M1 family metallopeptidase [Flavobacteriaceae bacterium]